mmetsp:Transcript_8604/g.24616  ORF Transcript_8604/g.24616 Transcript_8604/m.24616 type:complete len:302 (-) Transcript_8604:510-1415(-)
MVRNEGMATRRLSQSMPLHGDIMNAPMSTSGTAVATWGTALSKGPMKAERANSTATVTAMRPVLAPSTMPALLSLAMMTGLVPRRDPTIVASPALAKIEVLRGTAPSFSSPAMPMRPYCTPARSKSATKRKTRVPTTIPVSFPLPGAQASKLMDRVAPNSGRATIPAGGGASPVAQAQKAMSQMPTSIAPGTPPDASIAEIAQKPARARYSRSLDSDMSPRVTSVSGDPTTRPITWKPISAWKTPMATVIAFFRCSDNSTETTKWHTPKTARAVNRAPLTKQQLNASCQLTPKVAHKPKAK